MLRTRSLVVGIACLALATAAGCGGDDGDDSGGGGQGAPQQATSGKELFQNTCAGCHTLADAGTNGMVGPNLDDLQPDMQQVLNALRTGPGPMPENLLVGAEADAVAEYVSSAAGQ